jgi:2-polyprenyl-3-methyl-5-hydroxy-6-metoxy-1,4-benzoquinol methylase
LNTESDRPLIGIGKWAIYKTRLETRDMTIETRPTTKLTAKMEPFDSFWEAPEDVEKGYKTLYQFYKHNYLKHLPSNKDAAVLVVSCGPGYFVNMLSKEGYTKVLGIDSDPEKVQHAREKGLNCIAEEAFPFLQQNLEAFDVIFCECEINHLTKEEVLEFLGLCRNSLREGGTIIFHSINGANPITGIELLALNFDHYHSFTEYSMRQVLNYTNFREIKVIPLNLYVFYQNPLNYVGLAVDTTLTLLFKVLFKFYGKSNQIFTKKVAAVARK